MLILQLLLNVWAVYGSERLRLYGGDGPCMGRVEVFHNNEWGVVCNHKWQKANEEVICRSLGCGRLRSSSMDYIIPNVPREAWMNEVNCTGTELNLWNCTFPGWGINPCPTEQHVNVECSENVTLSLENGCSGAVQYTTSEGKGGVCSKTWGKKEAAVVCRELNCGTPSYIPLAGTFGAPARTLISSLNCTGDERFLWQCVTKFESDEECTHPVGVICSKYRLLRLMGGSVSDRNSCSGKLHVQEANTSKPFCQTGLELPNANELCSHFRCGNSGSLEPGACNGTEQVHLTCSDTVKIVLLDNRGKESKCFGAVHVERNGTYEAVCNDEWTERESRVVCQELGCGGASSMPSGSSTRVSEGQLNLVQCWSSPTSLWHCLARSGATSRCQGAYVVCKASVAVRLVDGLDKCSGRVEVLYKGTWRSVRSEGWSNRSLDALCRERNCGNIHQKKGSNLFSHGNGMMWDFAVSCPIGFRTLDECFKDQPLRTPARGHDSMKVICAGSKLLYLLGKSHCSGMVGIETGEENYWLMGSRDTWKNDCATAVCQQVQCGRALSIKTVKFSDKVHKPWKKTFNCSSNETFNCSLKASEHDTEIAFVNCSGTKSVSLDEQCWGKLRVCIDESCGGVCEDAWTHENSDMVCQDLGCGHALKDPVMSKTPGVLVKSVHCARPVKNMTQCNFILDNDKMDCQQKPVYIACSGSMQAKLQDPRKRCAGNVKLFVSGHWYPVCKDALEMDDTRQAICTEAGCGSNSTLNSSLYGPSTARGIPGITCVGNSLKECHINALLKDCKPGRLHCSGWVSMLLGDGNACQGRVFVMGENDNMYPVSNESWGRPEGKVLCRYLRCGEFVSLSGERSQLWRWWNETFSCRGNESSIWDCVSAVATLNPESHQLRIECSETLTVNLSGEHLCSGQVELNIGRRKVGVCGEHWGDSESSVVCRELNCSNAISHKVDLHLDVQRKVNYVSCDGKESKLWQCGTKNETCNTGLVSITCADSVQLRLTENCGGEVKMYKEGQWESICPLQSPTSLEAQLICEHLGCGKATRGDNFIQKRKSRDMSISFSCTGSEKFIRHCVKPIPCKSQVPAFVHCQNYVKPKTGLPTYVTLFLILGTVFVLTAALIKCLRMRRGRNLKTGRDCFERHSRALPKVPETRVKLGAETDSNYDEITDEPSYSSEEEPTAPALRKPLNNSTNDSSDSEGVVEYQEGYDDVIGPPEEEEVVIESLLLQKCENTSERNLSAAAHDSFIHPTPTSKFSDDTSHLSLVEPTAPALREPLNSSADCKRGKKDADSSDSEGVVEYQEGYDDVIGPPEEEEVVIESLKL